MLDFARWAEIVLLAGLALVLLGPKELPRVLYTLGRVLRKVRAFMGDIQHHFDAFMDQAEYQETQKESKQDKSSSMKRK